MEKRTVVDCAGGDVMDALHLDRVDGRLSSVQFRSLRGMFENGELVSVVNFLTKRGWQFHVASQCDCGDWRTFATREA
jgi:hypothetical protein